MTKILAFVFVFFLQDVSGQTRAEIVSTMSEYIKVNGKSNDDYADKKLNPALHKLKQSVCENGDQELLEKFLEMILETTSSANETPGVILGGIYICQPDLVENLLKGKYKSDVLNEYLQFGFESETYDKNNRPKNYDELRLRLKEITQ